MDWFSQLLRQFFTLDILEDVALEHARPAKESMFRFCHSLAIPKPHLYERGRANKIFSCFAIFLFRKRRWREFLPATNARSVSPLPDDPFPREKTAYIIPKQCLWHKGEILHSPCAAAQAQLQLTPPTPTHRSNSTLVWVGDGAKAEAAQGVVLPLPDVLGRLLFKLAARAVVDVDLLRRALV